MCAAPQPPQYLLGKCHIMEYAAYGRAIALSSAPIVGLYRFGDEFQIYPAPVGSPTTNHIEATYPFIIEVKYMATDQGKQLEMGFIEPDWINQSRRVDRINHVLLWLTTLTAFQLVFPKQRSSWFRSDSDRHVDPFPLPQWGTEAYILREIGPCIEAFTEPDYAAIQHTEIHEYHSRIGLILGHEFDLPDSITELLKDVISLDAEATETFLSACLLFRQAIDLWQCYSSLSFASAVSALETLIDYNHRELKLERCGTCGQERYRVVKKFLDFCLQYGVGNRKDLYQEYKKAFSKIYSIRSALLHTGKLMHDDLYCPTIGTWDNFEEREQHRTLLRLYRICALNWLRATAAEQRVKRVG